MIRRPSAQGREMRELDDRHPRPARRVRLSRVMSAALFDHVFHVGPAGTKILAVWRVGRGRWPPWQFHRVCPCEAVPAPSNLIYSDGDHTYPIRGRCFAFGGGATWDENAREDLGEVALALWFPLPQIAWPGMPYTLWADVVPDEGFITDGEIPIVAEPSLTAWHEDWLLTERGLDVQRYQLVREEGGFRITRREDGRG